MSALWHDAVGGDALAEDDAAEAVAGGDGVALVFALRAPVVRALRRAAGALCEPGVLVALLAPGAGTGGGGGVNLSDALVLAIMLTVRWEAFWQPGDGCSRWQFCYRLGLT